VNFQGRSSRGAYWWWVLFCILIDVVLTLLVRASGASLSFLFGVWGLAIILPSIALGFRRLHDIGRSAWWLLIGITGIGVLLLIWWFCQPGQRATNRFGPDVEAGK
jgi:uncharacterized membrane protein YhaH (DUF805 family)